MTHITIDDISNKGINTSVTWRSFAAVCVSSFSNSYIFGYNFTAVYTIFATTTMANMGVLGRLLPMEVEAYSCVLRWNYSQGRPLPLCHLIPCYGRIPCHYIIYLGLGRWYFCFFHWFCFILRIQFWLFLE